MIPVDQSEVGVENPRANCLMACVASILEVPLDSLPDVYDREQTGAHWYQVLTEALEAHGYRPVEGGLRENYHIAIGPSVRGDVPHAAVSLGESIVHDPHPSRVGLYDVKYWITFERITE